MAGKEEHGEKIQLLMENYKNIRNIGIVAHSTKALFWGVQIHHGKTALTDNLAAAAGMMAKDLVGERMLTWIDDRFSVYSVSQSAGT